MNPFRRRISRVAVTVLAPLLLLGTGTFAGLWVASTPAGASTTPPWEPDPDAVGALTLYNSGGQAITSGSLATSPIAAYVAGTATVRSGDSVATLYGYLPVSGEPTSEWSGEQLGLTTPYAPGPVPALNATGLPYETGNSGDESVSQLVADYPNTDTSSDGYAGLYQLRLYTNSPHKSQSTGYDAIDISVTGSTWTVVYPAPSSTTPPTSTSTTTDLSASPASPQPAGTSVTLTATVSPSTAPGTVQFENGGAAIGSPVTVSAGTASLTTSSLPAGTDALSAVYTSTWGSGFLTSTGQTSYTVTGSTTGPPPPPPPPPSGLGYWLVASDGGIFSFGSANFHGSTGGTVLNKPIVGMAATPDGGGYWLVASDGGVFAFGDAVFYGSTGSLHLNKPIVGIASTPDGKGYWLVASDGGIFAFGDALFYGSTGAIVLNKPIVGMAATPDGGGYWLVASDGGVFAFGDALFYGSTGGTVLNKPIVGIAADPQGSGYWLVASDGGIFAFGSSKFDGSTGGTVLNKPIVGIAPTPDGAGYWLVASDGGIFAFGDAGFLGSTGGTVLNKPIVGAASA